MKTSRTELQARMNKAWQDCKDFLDAHTNAEGIISSEDKATYDEMLKKVDGYKSQLALLDEVEKREQEMNEPAVNAMRENPAKKTEEKKGRASDSYKKLFSDFLRGAATVKQIRDALQEGTNSEGGYLVPQEFEKRVIEKLTELDAIRANAHVIKTSSSRKIPVEATVAAATWIAEEGQYQGTDPAFTQVTLDAFKVGQMIKVSDELLEDVEFDLEGYLADCLAKAIATAEETAFCKGDGSGKPTGIFTASGGAVGVTTSNNGQITADEVLDLVYSLKGAYRKRAKFYLNDATVKLVRKIKDGSGQYLWAPGLEAGQPDRLCGYEVVTCDAPTVASNAYVIAFGDLDYYWIADRTGMEIRRLNELYAENGQVGFRGTHRVDGKIVLSEAVQLMKMHA